MESSRARRALPDEVVMNIVAKMPFPSIFKASGLSKAWFARFRPTSALLDEEEKRVAVSFQAEVRERIRSLGTLFPISLDKHVCVAYSWTIQKWVRLPSLSFLPKALQDAARESGEEGVSADLRLVLVTRDSRSQMRFHVANIFTRCWKSLPSRPGVGDRERLACAPRVVRDSSSGAYKLLAFSHKPPNARISFASIYHFDTNAWTVFEMGEGLLWPCQYALLNGVVYVAYTAANPGVKRLVALNVEEGTSTILTLQCDGPASLKDDLMVCGGQLLMVSVCRLWRNNEFIRIRKVDLESQQLLEVGRGPPYSLKDLLVTIRQPDLVRPIDPTATFFNALMTEISGAGNYCKMAPVQSHGNYILFRKESDSRGSNPEVGWTRPMIVYDVLKDEWTRMQCSPVNVANTCDESFPDAAAASKRNSRCQDLSFEAGSDPFWPF